MKMCFITLRSDKQENGIPVKYRKENPFYFAGPQYLLLRSIFTKTHNTENPCILPVELKQLLPIGRSMHSDHSAKLISEPNQAFIGGCQKG